jgi:hypothetical protein
MRAKEFISEMKHGKISNQAQVATAGLNTFFDAEKWNSEYVLGRVMMAVACTDGKTPVNIDGVSWIGKSKSAHPYTKEEQDMLKIAYKAVGATWNDINHGDMSSGEDADSNIQSPVKPFKGYKK